MCRASDPHFQPWISVPEHIIFTNDQKIRSGASPFYLFCGFCRSGDHHFQNFFNFNPFIVFPRPTAGSARTQSVRQRRGLAAVPEIRIFTLKTDQARSGAPHFHAQNGSSSFRSPAFSSSKRLKLVPEPHTFTLDGELVPEPLPIFHFAAAHTYQNLRWVPPPPPPREYFICRYVHPNLIMTTF